MCLLAYYLDELDLALGQGQATEQSRVIGAQFEKILDALPFYVLRRGPISRSALR